MTASLPPLPVRKLRALIYSAPRPCGDRPDLFFGPDDEEPGAHAGRVAAARAICGGCPVRLACLARALRDREESGVWGGVDADAGELGYLIATARLLREAERDAARKTRAA